MHLDLDMVLQWVSLYGPIALFVLLILGIVGLPVPDETLMVFCGALIGKGTLHPVTTFAAAFLGSATGITVSYFIGKTAGKPFLDKFGPWMHLTPERLEQVHKWFDGYGHWSLTFGYFVPGVRHITAIVAGMTGLQYPVFARFAYAGSLIWVSTFLTLGYVIGDAWRAAAENAHQVAGIAAIVIVVVLGIIWYVRYKQHNKS